MDYFLSLFGKDITFFGAICSILGIVGTFLGIVNACVSIVNARIRVKFSLGFSFVVDNIQTTCVNPFKLLDETIIEAAKGKLFIYLKFKIINKSKYNLFIDDFGLTDSISRKHSVCFVRDKINMPRELKAFSSMDIPCNSYSIFDIADD